ncbi:hypothetical protein A9P82_12685 [Arachidicoccus ginsenosidimutans]|uniref:RNA polymerase sigma-70 factor n=1 Tax=Arachidicoccus sp. BS20 TaxID=1850526 RepID=UPI0007F07605|nr:RNA polymerase sigma-70 factor [Arachidicoccus sp. BS20]ANI90064.1 hypothetical protein A9P82_12685 [Arachidicoccus sp. BS20]
MEQKFNYHAMEDEQLFALSRQDEAAFNEIYSRYYSLLFHIAYKTLKCRQVAEDIVQDIFISLYQRREKIAFSVSLKAYLNKAVRFKIFNEMRAENIRSKYCKNVFSNESCKIVFADLETKELSQKINQVFYNLPAKCRDVFTLSRNNGYSQKDISQMLSISLSTVEKHIGKALKIFRKELSEYSYMFSAS